MASQSLRLITWDATGTLLRVRGSVGEQYKAAGLLFDLACPEVTSLNAAFREAYTEQSQHKPCYGSTCIRKTESGAWWATVVQETFKRCGVEDAPLIMKIADYLYHDMKRPDRWEVFGDVHPALSWCKAQGLRLGVLSNFDDRLNGILSGVGLRSYFDVVLTSDEMGMQKPQPEAFHLALKHTNVQAGQALHIGDDPVTDYLGATESGMAAFLLKRNKAAELKSISIPPHHILDSLDDLPPLLEATST
uniref:haloacid dehalogenase-like hydrolase domain-containing protein 3 isoform X1 n=1 Tax=Myxine glutinosa TaxID=7769 RepID=UPI0035901E46